MAPGVPKGWWRRNIVALVTILPLLGVVSGLAFIDKTYQFWGKQALIAVAPDASGWSEMDGVRLKFSEIADFIPTAFSGKPLELKPGTVAWKAVVDLELDTGDAAEGCLFTLEDGDGRLYSADPRELQLAEEEGNTGLAGCRDEKNPGLRAFQAVSYFVLPTGAKPVAVRAEWWDRYPRYARLPIG